MFGFTSMLINMLRDEQPTHIVVAFDVSRQSFRTEKYAEYKAGRSETPQPFQGQVSLIKEVLEALRIPVVEKPGYEADDVIGTLACQARDAGMEVVISTGDRDAFQLAGEHVTILYPVRGVSEVWRMTPDAIEAKYFVRPERYRDKAALVGEASDNLPGVPGVGDKTAAKWINEYGGLDGVVANADKIKGKAGESLRAHLADVHAQLRAQRAGLRPRAAAAARGRALARLGPGGRAPGLRRAGVPGAARAALLLPRGGRARGRVRLRPGRRGAGRRAGRRLAGRRTPRRGPGRRRGDRDVRPRHRRR